MATGLGDHLARPLTGRTYALRLHHAEEAALCRDDGARTVTGAAGLLAIGVGGPFTITVRAGDILLDLEFLLHALLYILEREPYTGAEVRAAERLTSAASASEATKASEVKAATAEEVAEAAEDILHAHAAAEASSTAAGGTATDTGVTELIVALALVGVTQHVIGLGQLLELLLGLLIPGVLIGVVLDGELAIGLLQLVGRSALAHPEYLVVISLCCHDLFLSPY